MIWGWLKEGGVFVKLLMEKEAITGVILAPDGVEYDRKHPQKEGSKKSFRIIFLRLFEEQQHKYHTSKNNTAETAYSTMNANTKMS